MTENTQEVEGTRDAPVRSSQAVIVSDENIAQVNVSADEIELEPYRKQYIAEKRKSVIIKGYRKGTAPEAMVSSFFGDEAREAAKNSIIYNKYMKLLQDHKLQALTPPKLDNIEDRDGKIGVQISVEVLQPIVLGQYLGLELATFPVTSSDEEVAKTLESIKYSYPKLTVVDTESKDKDVVEVDFSITVDGNVFEEQKALKLNLGLGTYFKEFEDNIVGMKKGDVKEFSITFPESYQKEQLRLKKADFAVTVLNVYNTSEHTDEELAKLFNHENIEKMMELISVEVKKKNSDDEHLFYENQILGQLLAAHPFKIPNSLIENELNKLRIEKPDLTEEDAKDVADRFVRTDLILHAIYERHPDIQFKQEEFNSKIEELAKRVGDTVAETIKRLQESGKLQSYINYLTNCKVIDFIIDMADKKLPGEVAVSTVDNQVVAEATESNKGE